MSLAAVDGLDLRIEAEEVVALLGPNGAGKTTTVEILEGYRTRDAGQVEVLGFDPQTGGRAFRERIGVVPQEAGFEENFTARELLRLHAGYYPHPRPVADVLTLTGLDEKADARVKTLSGGQRRRLDLALGIIGGPQLLFLDEPTTGFDPSARRRAWDLIERLRDLGATILLTTHYLDEAEHLAEGTPEELTEAAGAATVISFRLPADLSAGDLPDIGADRRLSGSVVDIRTTSPTSRAMSEAVSVNASVWGLSGPHPAVLLGWTAIGAAVVGWEVRAAGTASATSAPVAVG